MKGRKDTRSKISGCFHVLTDFPIKKTKKEVDIIFEMSSN